MSEHFSIIPASYLLFEHNGQVLLSKRFDTKYFDGYWGLPSGHVEENESAEAAAIREAKEEVGVDLEPENLELVHTMYRKVGPEDLYGKDRVDLFFKVIRWENDPYNAEPGKCSDLEWFHLDKLPDKMVPEVDFALGKIAIGKPYSGYGF